MPGRKSNTSDDIISDANLSKSSRPPHLITLVESSSPAAAAGLKIYDVLLAINGNVVTETNFRDLVTIVKVVQESQLPMELLVVEQLCYEVLKKKNVIIDGASANVLCTPKIMPPEYQDFPRAIARTCLIYLTSKDTKFGFDVVHGRDDKGLFIQEVVPDSAAYKGGLRKSDRIIEIGDKNVENESSRDSKEKLAKAVSDRAMKLTVIGTQIHQQTSLNKKDAEEDDTYVVRPAVCEAELRTPRVHRSSSSRDDTSLSVRSVPAPPANEYTAVENDYLPPTTVVSQIDRHQRLQEDPYLPPSDVASKDETTVQDGYCDDDNNDYPMFDDASPSARFVDDRLHVAATTSSMKQHADADYLEPATIVLQLEDVEHRPEENKRLSAAFVKRLENIIGSSETHKANQRFLDVHREPLVLMLPIEGYGDVPLVPLTIAIEKLDKVVLRITQNAQIALERCARAADGLTLDESASIQLYTMEGRAGTPSLATQLNTTLRAEDRDELMPYFAYFKLLLTALWKLRAVTGRMWRGAKVDLREQYPVGKTFVWWGFSSCMESCDLLLSGNYLGSNGFRTLFCIETISGRPIRAHSYNPAQNEVLILPATQLQVIRQERQTDDIYIIYVKEVSTPHSFLQIPLGAENSAASVITQGRNSRSTS